MKFNVYIREDFAYLGLAEVVVDAADEDAAKVAAVDEVNDFFKMTGEGEPVTADAVTRVEEVSS